MAYFSGPNIITSGLVLALDAASQRSYPGSGITWSDLSSSSSNATSQATSAATTAIFNSAGYFDLTEAADVYFLIPGLNNYNFYSKISIEFLMKNTGGDYRAIVQNSDDAAGDSDTIDIRLGRENYYGGGNNGTRCVFNLNSDSNKAIVFPVARDVWTRVHCNYNGTVMNVYLDGELFSSTSATGNIDTVANDMKLFRHYNTGEDLVNPFSSIMIYNRALTAAEVKQNFNALKNRFGS
tara:strand:+ start:257 stop:970 length:714 start_codon:yes stop_codon:yes gene_type:complete